MIEAMRILKAAGLKPRRTIRMGLWTGEEQGLLGCARMQHFADRTDMVLKPEHAKLAAYFNMDNGGGAFRGVYLQGNEAVSPIFEAWMKPFANLGMNTLTIRPTSGTDHLAFDGVGLPGFQFVQDPPGARLAHAPHQPGRLRARDPGRPDPERDHHRDLGVSRCDARPAAAAQARRRSRSRRRLGPAPGDAPADRVRFGPARPQHWTTPGLSARPGVRHALSGQSRRRWPRARMATASRSRGCPAARLTGSTSAGRAEHVAVEDVRMRVPADATFVSQPACRRQRVRASTSRQRPLSAARPSRPRAIEIDRANRGGCWRRPRRACARRGSTRRVIELRLIEAPVDEASLPVPASVFTVRFTDCTLMRWL